MMDQNALDLGLLLLRLTLGVTLVLHGVAKYRGGIAGVEGGFQGEDLKPGIFMPPSCARRVGTAAIRRFSFPGAMGYVGVMCVAGWVGHRHLGSSSSKMVGNTYLYWQFRLLLALLGPDLGLWITPWDRVVKLVGLWAIGGIGAAVALLLTLYRPEGDE